MVPVYGNPLGFDDSQKECAQMQTSESVTRKGNVISVRGRADQRYLLDLCDNIHAAITGDEDVTYLTLDFSMCEKTTDALMLPLLPIVKRYKNEGRYFTLIAPQNVWLSDLFKNTNWAHLIDSNFPAGTYIGHHVPALEFDDSNLGMIVDQIIRLVMSELNVDRQTLKAIEWSLGEIMDNVLNHANSPGKGYVQATANQNRSFVQFVVADAGVGIPTTLGYSDHHDVALERSISEGVTRDETSNAGNGLYGSYRTSILSPNGEFEIHSLHGHLVAQNEMENGIQCKIEKLPSSYTGTAIRCRIGVTDPELLNKALEFGGVPHDPPYDYIERQFEGDDDDIVFNMQSEAHEHTSSRRGGVKIRTMLENLLREHSHIVLDFQGLEIITSSFADEVLGRLYANMGPIEFNNRVKMLNISRTIKGLVERAFVQRTKLNQNVIQRQLNKIDMHVGEEATGYIHSLKRESGYGFLSIEENCETIFFHRSALVLGIEWEHLQEGMLASFRVNRRKGDNRFSALNVRARWQEDADWIHRKTMLESITGEKNGVQKIRILVVWALIESEVAGYNDTRKMKFSDISDPLHDLTSEYGISNDERDCAEETLRSIYDRLGKINRAVSDHSHRPFGDISTSARCILRAIISELMLSKVESRNENHICTILNSAVSLAKVIIGDDRFVGGVLSSMPFTNITEFMERQVGGIVYRTAGLTTKFALVQTRASREKWTMSKGKLQYGEEDIDGFKRVVREELGLDVINVDKQIFEHELYAEIPCGIRKARKIKKVKYFIGGSNDGRIVLAKKPGLVRARFFTLLEIRKRLDFYDDTEKVIIDACREVVREKRALRICGNFIFRSLEKNWRTRP